MALPENKVKRIQSTDGTVYHIIPKMLQDGTTNYVLNVPTLTADSTIATTSNLSSYLPLSGGTMTGAITPSSDRVIDFGGASNRYHYGYFARLMAVESISNSTSYDTNMITLPSKSGTMALTSDIPEPITPITTTPTSSVNRWPGAAYEADISHFVTPNDIYYWNGAVTGTASNLAYCNQGAFGSIVTHSAGDYLPITGGTITGNLNVTGTFTVASNATLQYNSNEDCLEFVFA